MLSLCPSHDLSRYRIMASYFLIPNGALIRKGPLSVYEKSVFLDCECEHVYLKGHRFIVHTFSVITDSIILIPLKKSYGCSRKPGPLHRSARGVLRVING